MRGFEEGAKVQLALEQRAAIAAAAETNLLVVTGGPGVGKTTIVRAMLATFARAKLEVRLAAPTGRAAKRLSEANLARGVDPAPAARVRAQGADVQEERQVAARRRRDHRRRGLDDRPAARRQPAASRRPGHTPGPGRRRRPAAQRRSGRGAPRHHRLRRGAHRAALAHLSARRARSKASSWRTRTAFAKASRRSPRRSTRPGPISSTVERRDPEQAAAHHSPARHRAHPQALRARPAARCAGADADAPWCRRVDHPERRAPGRAQPERSVDHRGARSCGKATR